MKHLILFCLFCLTALTQAQTETQEKLEKKREDYRLEHRLRTDPRPTFQPFYMPYYYSQGQDFNYNTDQPTCYLGLSYATNQSLGLSVSLGTQTTVIQLRASKPNPYKHYTNISRREIKEWQDELLEQYTTYTEISIERQAFKQLPILIGFNLQVRDRDLIYLDDTNTLPYPNSQYYSIDLDQKLRLQPKLSIVINYKRIQGVVGIQAIRRPTLCLSMGIRV